MQVNLGGIKNPIQGLNFILFQIQFSFFLLETFLILFLIKQTPFFCILHVKGQFTTK